jgi:hypothetical protein
MSGFFPKPENLPGGIDLITDRKLSYTGRLKTGNLNRKQYK